MWRFTAVHILTLIGAICFFLADYVQRCALITAFGVAVLLPLVLNPTRHWARGFFLCFDLVYAAACIGAGLGALAHPVPRLEVFIAGVVPGLMFGTMASLGVRTVRSR